MVQDSTKIKMTQKTREKKLKTWRSQKCLVLNHFQTKRKFLKQIKTTEVLKNPQNF